MRKEDIRQVRRSAREIEDQTDELIELIELNEDDNATITDTKFEELQTEIQNSLVDLMHDLDEVVNSSDEIEIPGRDESHPLPGGPPGRDEDRDMPGPPEHANNQ